ncbi:MAG: STAS domain-containing protein [Ardenticatenaceae bacterium]|nr:STAS domain-containing protein [Anaerolineales bacterium]MCB8921953.1 STAS domain-containing protein [Ardenticatenaceae bacterium]MCB8989529.1 STAS domain-containing protein [Ardenticatenaceae bacterium]MCB9003072.1 STAS domain-containing protein [Ardenticatenaceae bacterium]
MSVWQQVTSTENQIWLIGVRGRLDQNLTPQLENNLNTLLADGVQFLVVDLDEVTYINSGGLRCLVSGWRKCKRQDGNLVLCNLNGRLREIFIMVGFDNVFDIYPTRQEAQQAILAAAEERD